MIQLGNFDGNSNLTLGTRERTQTRLDPRVEITGKERKHFQPKQDKVTKI